MKEKVLIIGAGQHGRVVAHILKTSKKTNKKYYVIGFLDDNSDLIKTNVDGIPVLGKVSQLETIGKKYKIKITQTYNERFDTSHYIVIFEDLKGNIVSTISTTCGSPSGKIGQKELDEYIKGFKRDQGYREKELEQDKEFDKIMKERKRK